MTSSSEITINITSAEAEARKRRERILQLKKKAQGQSEIKDETNTSEVLPPVPSLPVGDTDDSNTPLEIPEKFDDFPTASDELDLNNLASRKVDWDLKRGIEKSLEKLQERTNEIITEMVRERLIEENNDE